MPKFFDTESGQEVSLNSVGSLFQAGRLGVQGNGEKVYVTDHNGVRYSTTDPAELGSMLAEGFRVESPEETQLAVAKKEAEDSPILAGVEAAARGATLGLSDVALDATLGSDYTKNAALRREALGPLRGVAEIGGAIAPALLSGGALGYTPAGLLTRGAEALGAATERTLVSRGLGQGAARLAGMAAEGTLDGTLSAIGAELSEATLGDSEITAERLIAAGGIGGLLGLVGGTGTGVLANVGRRGSRAIADRRVAKLADEALDTGEELGAKDAGLFRMVPDAVIDRASKLSSDPEITKAALTDKSFRSDILNRDVVTQDLNKRMRVALQDTLDTDHLTRQIFAGEPKSYNVYQDIPDNLAAGQRAMRDVDVIVGDYRKGLEDLNATGMLSALEYKRLSKEIDHTLGQVRKGFSVDGHNAESFLALENFKRVADDRRKKTARNVTGDLAQRETLPAIHKLSSDLGDQLRKHLESQDFYGEAGRKQAERNAAGHAVFNTGGGFNRQLAHQTGESLNEEYWDVERRVIDGNKMEAFLGNLSNPNKEFDVGQVKRHLQALDDLYETLKRNNDIPENFSEDQFEKARSGVKSALATLDEASDRLGKIGRFDAVEKAGQDLGTVANLVSSAGKYLGGAAGYTVGGAMGAAIGGGIGAGLPKILGMAVNPGELVRTAGRIEALKARSTTVQERVRTKTQSAVQNLSKPKKERRVGTLASRAVVRGVVRDRAAEAERARKVERRLSEFDLDQMRLIDALAYQARGIDAVAPATTAAYQRQMLRAMEFLRGKLPKPSSSPNRLQPQLNKSLWDTGTADKFGRYLDVLEDPTRALNALENGRLTTEHVEVLKAVYPTIYEEMKLAAIEEVAKKGDEMPYDSVVQLSLLFDFAGHPTMTPEFQQTLQQVRQKAKEANKAQAPSPSNIRAIQVPQSYVDRLMGGLSAR